DRTVAEDHGYGSAARRSPTDRTDGGQRERHDSPADSCGPGERATHCRTSPTAADGEGRRPSGRRPSAPHAPFATGSHAEQRSTHPRYPVPRGTRYAGMIFMGRAHTTLMLLATLAVTVRARAQPARDAAGAETLFLEGRKLMESKEYALA